ncbi:ABC transporter permease [Arthrobacter sp. MA-N2]|uniref:ABC transporter permease n=1 Tax=Arthrobacter sp. MA-N2 TaxID=1101188 RepID=UPI000485C604|nr:ABC transporter permease [Arthrobacter sp. MA-N2]
MKLRWLVGRISRMVALPAILLLAWWAFSYGSTNPYWPSLAVIFDAFPGTWTPERLIGDMLPSLARLLLGYAMALAFGVALGTAIGSLPTLRALCDPILEFVRAVPPPILLPIVALFAGYTSETSKIVTIGLGCTWPILLNTIEGVRSLEAGLLDAARSFRFRPSTRLFKVILPGASPRIAAGARLSLAIGVVLMVISEMFAADRGLGASVVQFQRTFAIPQMWTGIMVLGLIGVALSAIFQFVESRVLAWYHGQRRTARTSP